MTETMIEYNSLQQSTLGRFLCHGGNLRVRNSITIVKGFALLFGAVLMLGISSCSIRNNFEGQPVPGSTKVPPLKLSLAVMSDRSLSFVYPPIYSLSDFEEVMNPGLAETLRNGFDPGFKRVMIVESESDAAEMDLLATPTIEVADPMTLTVTFTEPRSGREIAKISSSRGLDGHAFGTYSHLGTDVMLFAAVLVVPPLDPVIAQQIRKHSAQRFNAMFTPAVVEMVSDIAQRTLRDSALASFSRSATFR